VSGIVIAHLRPRIAANRLRADLARLLDLTFDELVPLADATPATLLPYAVFERPRGFATTLELYASRAPARVPQTDLELARLLARHYRVDALASPQKGIEPYTWLLVRPWGEAIDVREAPSEDPNVLLIVEPPRSRPS
jgi:hypothetical protein